VIVGIGIDIVSISRVEKALERTPKLAERVLTPLEFEEWQQSQQPARFLAKRFAAKEAAVKALGTGIGRGVGWQQLEISKSDLGRPLISLSGAAADIAETLGALFWHLSYSDEVDYVVAQVIAESR